MPVNARRKDDWRFTDTLRVGLVAVLVVATIALVVAFPWLLIVALAGSPLFLGGRTR